MPIANCIVASGCNQGSGNLIELWSKESGISDEHMTANIIFSDQQLGNKYTIMANLQLPSIWSPENISAIQKGLAHALSGYFGLSINKIHVVTNVVSSGMVVENGQEVNW